MSPFKRPESVLVVIHSRTGRVLLLRRADLPEFWQSVTGAMRWDETDPRLTAAREVKEETGIDVAPAALRDLNLTARFPILPQFRHRYAPEVTHNIEHAFALELDDERTPVLSGAEHTAAQWVEWDEARRRVTSWSNRDAFDALATVVLVHGWWMKGWWMAPLARRLRRAGFEVRTFSYASVRADLRENARRLGAFLDTLPAGPVHLVGHSLGGIVIRALLHYFPPRRWGRCITLGSPHHGSRAAANLGRVGVGRALLGRSVMEVIARAADAWPLPAREIGVLSGTRSFGIGRWLAPLPRPNDGTLTVDETMLAGVPALLLPVTHTGMLTSGRVAEAVIRFLRAGDFKSD